MTLSASSARECGNALLAMLPDNEFRALVPHLHRVALPIRTVVYERGQPIEHVYFPCTGAHSILAYMETGAAVEVGTVGNEGFSTVDVLIGGDYADKTTVSQVPGESLRLPVAVFKSAIAGDTELRRVAFRYLQAYLAQVSQSVACNRLHVLEERFARWVLMSHDRVPGDEFQLTQEYLADMLGVHRPSVSLVARAFQQAGLIQYSRGTIKILDRAGLEEASCECYDAVKNRFERLLGRSTG